jgi:hypothetical protein
MSLTEQFTKLVDLLYEHRIWVILALLVGAWVVFEVLLR